MGIRLRRCPKIEEIMSVYLGCRLGLMRDANANLHFDSDFQKRQKFRILVKKNNSKNPQIIQIHHAK